MENKQLDHLMTYTVFHIGVYISLTGALIGAGIFGTLDHFIIRWARRLLFGGRHFRRCRREQYT